MVFIFFFSLNNCCSKCQGLINPNRGLKDSHKSSGKNNDTGRTTIMAFAENLLCSQILSKAFNLIRRYI
jgi:hypothetical protein